MNRPSTPTTDAAIEPFTRAAQARTALTVGNACADLTQRRITPAAQGLLDIQHRYGLDGTRETARLLAHRIIDTQAAPVEPDHTAACDLHAALLGGSFTPGRTYFHDLADAHPVLIRYLDLHTDQLPELARALWNVQHQLDPHHRIPALLSLLAVTAAPPQPLKRRLSPPSRPRYRNAGSA